MKDDNDDLRDKSKPFIQHDSRYEDKIIKATELHPKIAQLIPTKSDVELAAELREKIEIAYRPLIELMDEYDKHGFAVQAGIGKNAFGKYQIVQLQIIKAF